MQNMTELMPKKKTNNLQRDLEKAYDEALKNEDFKELVVKLKRKRVFIIETLFYNTYKLIEKDK